MPLLSSGLVLLALLSVFGPTTLLSHPATDLQFSPLPPASGNRQQVVNVIVAGATGDLASKYLWVAMFRLALESKAISGRTVRFFAGASDTLERGKIWHDTFFDDAFAERVCGAWEADPKQVSTAKTKCREFLATEFKPSVRYAPLRMESHYRDLGKMLMEKNEQLPEESEEGRVVYLAIPPQFFLQVRKSWSEWSQLL